MRKNYCVKAVESTEQIKFLAKWYGAAEAEPSKKPFVQTSSSYKNTSNGGPKMDLTPASSSFGSQVGKAIGTAVGNVYKQSGGTSRKVVPVTSTKDIWIPKIS